MTADNISVHSQFVVHQNFTYRNKFLYLKPVCGGYKHPIISYFNFHVYLES